MVSELPKKVISLNKSGNRRGMHPNTLIALEKSRGPTQIKPGEILNPHGLTISARARELYDEECEFDAKGRTWRETLARDLLRHAHLKNDGMRTLLDRHEGPVDITLRGVGEGGAILIKEVEVRLATE